MKQQLSKSDCHNIAQKYQDKSLFHKERQTVYLLAKEKGWFDFITSHMPKRNTIKWDKAKLSIEANKYSTLTEFNIQSNYAYKKASELGVLSDATLLGN